MASQSKPRTAGLPRPRFGRATADDAKAWLAPPENPCALARLLLETSGLSTLVDSPEDHAREWFIKIAALRLARAVLGLETPA